MTETSSSALSRWELAISKLVEFTQDEKLEWEIVDANIYMPNSDVSGVVLMGEFAGKQMLLCQKGYIRSSGGLLAAFPGIGAEMKNYRAELSIYSEEAKVTIYTFPYSKLTDDLYRAATYRASKVDELISALIEEAKKSQA